MPRAKQEPVGKQLPKDRSLDDMRRFHRSLDMSELWEEFYVSMDSSGRPKYNSAKHFARCKAASPKQLEFLTWLFGPKDDDAERDLEYIFTKPLEFDKRRDTGGWFTDEALRAHSKEITREINALDALRAAGNGITINSLSRMETLARRLDEEFRGRFFVDGVSFKENVYRAKAYLGLHDKLLHMIGYAQDIYAKSHGVNFNDMSAWQQLLTAAAVKGAVSESRADRVFKQLAEMAFEKAAQHRTELPPEVHNVITIEAKRQKIM